MEGKRFFFLAHILAEGSILLNDPFPVNILTSLSPQIPFKSNGRNVYISHFPSRVIKIAWQIPVLGLLKLQRR